MNVPELVSILRGYPSVLADWEGHVEEIHVGVYYGDIGPNGEYWPESTRRFDDAVEYAAQLRGAVAYHRDYLAKLARLTGKVLTLETGFPRTGGPPDEFQNALNDVLKNWTEENSEPPKPVERRAETLAGDDVRAEADCKPTKPRRGRREGSAASDVKEDQRIADAWATGQHASQEELATAFDITKPDVVAALDRHRKRPATPETIRAGKRRQAQ